MPSQSTFPQHEYYLSSRLESNQLLSDTSGVRHHLRFRSGTPAGHRPPYYGLEARRVSINTSGAWSG